jgi:hypothetical protein
MTGINIKTAQHYMKKYDDDEEKRLSVCVRKLETGLKARLIEVHSQFLVEYVDRCTDATLSHIRQNLRESVFRILHQTSASRNCA